MKRVKSILTHFMTNWRTSVLEVGKERYVPALQPSVNYFEVLRRRFFPSASIISLAIGCRKCMVCWHLCNLVGRHLVLLSELRRRRQHRRREGARVWVDPPRAGRSRAPLHASPTPDIPARRFAVSSTHSDTFRPTLHATFHSQHCQSYLGSGGWGSVSAYTIIYSCHRGMCYKYFVFRLGNEWLWMEKTKAESFVNS